MEDAEGGFYFSRKHKPSDYLLIHTEKLAKPEWQLHEPIGMMLFITPIHWIFTASALLSMSPTRLLCHNPIKSYWGQFGCSHAVIGLMQHRELKPSLVLVGALQQPLMQRLVGRICSWPSMGSAACLCFFPVPWPEVVLGRGQGDPSTS